MYSLGAFIVTCLFLSFLPGPNNVIAMTHSMQSGCQKAIWGVFGRFPAFGIMIFIAAIIFDFAITINQNFFKIIQLLGCIYMIYIGICLIKNRNAKIAIKQNDKSSDYVYTEFLAALSNPKAIILFTSFFPNFLNSNESVLKQFLFLGLLAMGAEGMMAMLYVLLGRMIKVRNLPFSKIYIVSGIFIIFISLRILYKVIG